MDLCYNYVSRMIKGTVFDIKKYALHDGPGIRTTIFFKGCPLRCLWCHNPEGQAPQPEIFLKASRCLKECRECLPVCEQRAISKKNNSPVINRLLCIACGKCAEACPSGALEIAGKEMSVEEVMAEIEKDVIFYQESGGGISFSGGEPLLQVEFLDAILDGAKEKNIHTTVDTSGFASFASFEKIAGQVDLFLYDIKLLDDRRHKKYTGVSNKIILKNLKRLAKRRKNIIVRIPLIPEMNDDEENILSTAAFLQSLKSISHISLLPYHAWGKEKYPKLDKAVCYGRTQPLPKESVEKTKALLVEQGFSVMTGD